MVRYWKISAGKRGIFLDLFRNNHIIALGEYLEGDLTQYNNAQAIFDAILRMNGHRRPHVSKYCYDFANNLAINDIVVVYNRTAIHMVGKVVSDYYYRSDGLGTPDYVDGLPHRRKVEWLLTQSIPGFHSLGRTRFAFFELVGNNRTNVQNLLHRNGIRP